VTAGKRSGQSERILNLCFHGIGTPGRALEPAEDEYWLDVAQFEEMLKVIVNYRSIRLTFDDGNASDIVFALPALRRLDLKATFFIISSRLDQPGSLASADLRTLVSNGMRVGSHGMRHRPWRFVDDSELEAELGEATLAIAQAAGRPIREVACPFGSYDRRVLKAIRRHEFARVYTVDGGTARSDEWLQSRYTVRAADTPASIERMTPSQRDGRPTAVAQNVKSFVKRWR
jgi:peptidoglycan/xylan/chitin deacetylase (PgdA/CDA1 family)